MYRGRKLVAIATGSTDTQDRSENIASQSSYHDPNKRINILEDIQFHYLDTIEVNKTLSSIHETSDSQYNITSQTDTRDTLITNTDCTDITLLNETFNSTADDNVILFTVDSSITNENIDPTTSSDFVLENVHNFDTFTSQTLETIPTYENSSPIQVIPNLSISDDSDVDKRLVPYSDSDSDSFKLITKSKKRKKRFQVDKNKWFSEQNRKRREIGKQYFGREKTEDSWNYNKPRKARKMKPRCSCRMGKYSTLKCETVTEDARKNIFNMFWNLTWGEKKTLVNEWVTTIPSVRPRNRKTADKTKRSNTFIYHLKVNNENVKVCRQMFLNTLDMGRWTIQNWKLEFLQRPPSVLRCPKQTESISEPKNLLVEFLDSLPKMESHYCRATSQKLYLLPEWKSKESLYQFYVNDWCIDRNIKPLSICLFSNLFEEKNLSLFKPKKDQCEKCAGHKVGAVTEEQYNEHIRRKELAREEKEKDKKSDNYVFTVDLQAVLLAPKSNVSTLYYKTKLQVHNLCFFNLMNKDGFSFIWNEVEGGLNAEEFASIWVDFLENTIIPDITAENKTIIIYSDGCTYQNRNCVLSNALSNIVMRHQNITIEQKFLEVGHTQMEADSMHSAIERRLKDRVIHVPAEYISIIRHARKSPAPYKVKYLNHNYFKKFDRVQFYKSIRPGRSKGDPKVTDIRALRYESNGSILYKINFSDEWQPLPQRRSLQCNPRDISDLPQLYLERRKITARKFEDLQQIKTTLPSDYHKYYDDLPHE